MTNPANGGDARGQAARLARVAACAPTGEPGESQGSLLSTVRESVLCRHPPAMLGSLGCSRRTFLRGTAAIPALRPTLSLAALVGFSTAPSAGGTAESWDDQTFWDDGSGWV